jgi:hypothetical protein
MLQDCLQSGLLAMMTIGEQRIDCLKLMCEALKFVEELAGSYAGNKDAMIGSGPNDTRTDEIEAADVVSSVRLVYKTYEKKEAVERQKRQIRINS